MLQAGGRLDFPQEPLRAEHMRQLGPEDLDRHLAVVPEVVRQIDDRMPPRPSSRSTR